MQSSIVDSIKIDEASKPKCEKMPSNALRSTKMLRLDIQHPMASPNPRQTDARHFPVFLRPLLSPRCKVVADIGATIMRDTMGETDFRPTLFAKSIEGDARPISPGFALGYQRDGRPPEELHPQSFPGKVNGC